VLCAPPQGHALKQKANLLSEEVHAEKLALAAALQESQALRGLIVEARWPFCPRHPIALKL
jgi:hypothetical protein